MSSSANHRWPDQLLAGFQMRSAPPASTGGGEDTGYASMRALTFQQLPTAGIPFHFDSRSEYVAYVADLLHISVFDDISEIRCDVRPANRLGTVEIRICDGMSSLEDTSAITAPNQCLVHDMSMALEVGYKVPVVPACTV